MWRLTLHPRRSSIIVGATSSSPATGTRADLLAATYYATEAALRLVKPGGKNWDVVDGVKKVLGEYQGTVKGLEGAAETWSASSITTDAFRQAWSRTSTIKT